MKLTIKAVEAATPGTVLHDTETRGFHLRVSTAGKRAYFLYYRTKSGKERRPKIGDHGALKLEQARNIAREWLARVARGEDPSADRMSLRSAPSVADLSVRYQREHAAIHKKEKSARSDNGLWRNHILPRIGKEKVADLTLDDIARLHHAIGKKNPTTANRALALMSKALNLAEGWRWRPLNSNPCRHVQRYPERKRTRRLAPVELAAVAPILVRWLHGAKPRTGRRKAVFAGLVLTILFTGARLNEIMRARWESIHWGREVLTVEEFKGGKRSERGVKEITLPPPAIEVLRVLEGVKRKGNPHVFWGLRKGQPLTDVRKPWKLLMAEAGITDRLIRHDLRRTFASAGLSSGVGLDMIGTMLGHQDPITTKGYADLYEAPRQEAAAKAAALLETWMHAPVDSRQNA